MDLKLLMGSKLSELFQTVAGHKMAGFDLPQFGVFLTNVAGIVAALKEAAFIRRVDG